MTTANQYGNADASYQAAGGIEGIRRLVDDFYLLLDSEPKAGEVRAMHPASLDMARDKLACFLSGWLGGPRLYSEKYGSISIPAFHAKWPIDQAHSEAWLHCMKLAIERQGYPAPFAEYLLRQLRVPAERVVQASANRRAAQS
ncbi:group II truncated hemoglobin [Pseudomonas segetis]|uniref:Hemoglobin n=1 Tax=Pseudomonas segetis TaxID=298908 RepID=A0A239AAC2_9PSED|nr:group II truncated hemoglobin [Pseudomonas segetis]SNR92281.1 hemoglobin [Pseudomonas segetis]